MKWLVEEYDDQVKELVEEIKKQGHEVDFIKYYDMIRDPDYTGIGLPKGKGTFESTECVLFYGSIQLAQWIQRNKSWVPGVWASFERYKCSHYYSYLGQYLLNQDYSIYPVGEVDRLGDELFRRYGEDECIFIRPDSGTKSFGGKCFERERWDKDWSHATHLMDKTDLVIVSSPKIIGKEYRFIVDMYGNILGASQYKDKGSAEIITGATYGAYALCREVLNNKAKFHPDPMYTIDICEAGDKYHLVEINAFSSSGLYACDLSSIVARASLLAEMEHKEIFNP